MRKFERKLPQGLEKIALIETGEFPEILANSKWIEKQFADAGSSWMGGTYSELKEKIRTGDDRLVEASDRFMAQLENQVPMSRGWRNVDDVVGAVPNVPAFLAGHPQCMRRRMRTAKENAPLAIYMDLTSSASIAAADVQKRGTVLLALTRLLVEHRPVELWVGTSIGKSGMAGTTAWRIDTAPLDLARAAFHVSATMMARGFGYGVAEDMCGCFMGSWPFGDMYSHKATAMERLSFAFEGQELMYIPPIHERDQMTADPVGWLRKVMAQYTGNGDE